jgi:metal-responsive CopG/Arc/MetJ family transcriptional regulator
MLNFRSPDYLTEMLDDFAFKNHLSRSEAIRWLIKKGIRDFIQSA